MAISLAGTNPEQRASGVGMEFGRGQLVLASVRVGNVLLAVYPTRETWPLVTTAALGYRSFFKASALVFPASV